MATTQLTAVIIGAGHRGVGYAGYSRQHPEELKIVGVADPDPVRRAGAGEAFGIPPENRFQTAEELAARPRLADVAINGTMDADHVPTTLPLLEAGYHILLEKPICPTREELLKLLETVRRTERKVVIGHVLRHAPFYAEIRRRVVAGDIGPVRAVNTTERVSYHHMAVGFVRGKWNHRDTSTPILMAKCCHDLDLIAWMKSGVRPVRVASFGNRMFYVPERAPEGAGTRCLVDCAIERDCPHSAYKHYIEQNLWGAYAWHSLEYLGQPTTEQKIASLKTDNPHGRCVWRTDCNQVDSQSVLIDFADGALGNHSLLTGTAKPCRTLHLVGETGEIEGSVEDGAFVIRHPDARAGHEYTEETVDLKVSADMHGGGDYRLVADFLRVVRGEEPSLSTTDVTDSVYGHLIAFAADEAMLNHQVVEIEDVSGGA